MKADKNVCAPTPARTLVLGLGNDILTDDAIGLHVARALRQRFTGDPSVEVRETTEMGLALLDLITGFETVFIVDSIQTGKAAPGTIHELDPQSLKVLMGRTPHFVGVGETLALGNQLGLPMPNQVRIFAIEIEDAVTVSTSLSASLAAALPDIAEIVQTAIVKRTGRAPQPPR
jgi:hydrogenase maturation protease